MLTFTFVAFESWPQNFGFVKTDSKFQNFGLGNGESYKSRCHSYLVTKTALLPWILGRFNKTIVNPQGYCSALCAEARAALAGVSSIFCQRQWCKLRQCKCVLRKNLMMVFISNKNDAIFCKQINHISNELGRLSDRWLSWAA